MGLNLERLAEALKVSIDFTPEDRVKFEIMRKSRTYRFDSAREEIIAGKTGSGKSTLCKILANEFNYLHLDFDAGDLKMIDIGNTTCKDLERLALCNHKGLILDCPISILNKLLSDFDTYKWNIPIVIVKQLNRKAMENIKL